VALLRFVAGMSVPDGGALGRSRPPTVNIGDRMPLIAPCSTPPCQPFRGAGTAAIGLERVPHLDSSSLSGFKNDNDARRFGFVRPQARQGLHFQPGHRRRELEAVAKRSGWEVVKVYQDSGISGAKGRDSASNFIFMRGSIRPGIDFEGAKPA
jgi:hypothetical protein